MDVTRTQSSDEKGGSEGFIEDERGGKRDREFHERHMGLTAEADATISRKIHEIWREEKSGVSGSE